LLDLLPIKTIMNSCTPSPNSRIILHLVVLLSWKTKLLNYIKNDCDDRFVFYHTVNEKMRMKRSAKKDDVVLTPGEKDSDIGRWFIVNTPDNLFKHEVDLNF